MPVGDEVTSPFPPSGHCVLNREGVLSSTNGLELFSSLTRLDGLRILDLGLDNELLEVQSGSTTLLLEELSEVIDLINEGSGSLSVDDLGDLTVESRIVELSSGKHELELVDFGMSNVDLNPLHILSRELEETNGSGLRLSMGIVKVSPDSFDVGRVVDVGDDVRVAVGSVEGGEVIEALALPVGKQSVTETDILMRVVDGEAGHEVPGSIFTLIELGGEPGQESEPESVAVLLDVGRKLLLLSVGVDDRVAVSSGVVNERSRVRDRSISKSNSIRSHAVRSRLVRSDSIRSASISELSATGLLSLRLSGVSASWLNRSSWSQGISSLL